MLTFVQRLPALFLALALAAGPGGVCAGRAAAPEARMACCSDDRPCPMHPSESEDGPARVLTQAEADRCCALSGHDSAPSPAGVAFVVALAPAPGPVPALHPEPERHADVSRASAPVRAAHVPKHVLLSVFLV